MPTGPLESSESHAGRLAYHPPARRRRPWRREGAGGQGGPGGPATGRSPGPGPPGQREEQGGRAPARCPGARRHARRRHAVRRPQHGPHPVRSQLRRQRRLPAGTARDHGPRDGLDRRDDARLSPTGGDPDGRRRRQEGRGRAGQAGRSKPGALARPILPRNRRGRAGEADPVGGGLRQSQFRPGFRRGRAHLERLGWVVRNLQLSRQPSSLRGQAEQGHRPTSSTRITSSPRSRTSTRSRRIAGRPSGSSSRRATR